MRTFFCAIMFWLVSVPAFATTSYYVSNVRTSNGSGTLASPWKLLSNISWTTVNTALASGEVDIYVDSRQTNSEAGTFTIARTDTSTNFLKVIGNAFYATGATGTATWTAESSPYSAATNSGNLAVVDTQVSGSGVDIPNQMSYVRVQGIYSQNAGYGCFNMGGGTNPTTNMTHIEIVGCKGVSPANNHGVWNGYAETGCSDILVSGCYISGTPLEGIYMGHYSYLSDTITNVIIENNYVVDCGLTGEGDIDIKPGCYGAIIRGNINTRSAPSLGGANCGTVIAANNCQVYGNRFYSEQEKGDTDWGYGIYINSEGDAQTAGKAITACLVYNNLIYINQQSGIRVLGTAANCTGVKIYNNTIYGNGVNVASGGMGIEIRSSTSPYSPFAQATVQVESINNFINGNVTFQCYTTGAGSSFTSSNYNSITGTGLCQLLGVTKSWAQWQSAGFDASGLNTAPTFTNAGAGDFTLQAGSAGATAGFDLSGTFTTDFTGATRTVPWSIGAYKAATVTTNSSSLSGKILLSGKVQIK